MLKLKCLLLLEKKLNLYNLMSEIISRGGIQAISESRTWKVVSNALHISPDYNNGHASSILKKHFARWVEPFLEEHGSDKYMEDPNDKKRKRIDEIDILPSYKKRRISWRSTHEESFNGASESMSRATEDEPIGGYEEFGYLVGNEFTLNQYKEMADKFEHTRFGDVDPNESVIDELSRKENEYWKIINEDEDISVQYGSDLDIESHGSGFPCNPNSDNIDIQKLAEKFPPNDATSYMLESGWNLHNLPGATFLHHLDECVSGITRPMLYIGMLFSSFCWHTEDNYLYSINYVHTGKPKRWYSIPFGEADAFERVMREKFPHVFSQFPNLLHLLVTQLSPEILRESGVKVYSGLQKEGQIVVTCPRGYHAGFNLGFNIAESVNFAIEDWLPICRLAVNNYKFQRCSTFSFEEFLLKAAGRPDSLTIARMLKHELELVIQHEAKMLNKIKLEGIVHNIKIPEEGQYKSCDVCGYDCYTSYVTCKSHDQLVCLDHSEELCRCPGFKKSICTRIDIAYIQEKVDFLVNFLKDLTRYEI
eukprot:TRINITY_DN8466_c0_g1_i3.p1 TRINITY_DN8466_c0_g1~~TRINITY_DN8466_c0_g1_i3.p1  ORF type:complete len:535 (+),score=106.78 TRINITY_DN8466_c0_g1_i3:326-1930(+)